MAARIQKVCRFTRQCTASPAWQRYHRCGNTITLRRQPFSRSARAQAKDEDEDEDEGDDSTRRQPAKRPMQLALRRDGEINPDFADYLGNEELEIFKSLSDDEIRILEETTKLSGSAGGDNIDDFDMDEKLKSDLKLQMRDAQRAFDSIRAEHAALRPPSRIEKEQRVPEGFFNMNEAEDKYSDEEEEGDISSLAHGEMEKHREQREYARLAAWEMPMLSKLVKPFKPPNSSQPLRFRYTTYLGEQHPASSKVVVEFCPSDMTDLTQIQRDKLIKLCGARYNPSSEIVRLNCESFPNQAQNKRYLADRVNKLLAEARDDSDTFADVPFDFRYHKPHIKHEFPKNWILTDARKAELERRREQRQLVDKERRMQGLLVDGLEQIRKNFSDARYEPQLVMANALRQRK